MTPLADWSPYRIFDGALGVTDPVLLSISGGRTSGYLLRMILNAYNGVLPPLVHPVFTNTARELSETYDFLADMQRHWSTNITWIERDFDAPEGFRVVSHNSASRNGEPFAAVIQKRGFLPNAVMRFCTVELKIRAAANWMKAQGYTRWCSIVGYRADESHRLLKAHARDETGKDPWYTLAPMVDAGVTKRDVQAFWRAQPFDLRLPNLGGKTPLGNCDLCFLKSAANLQGIAREFPERAAWWVEQERLMRGKAKTKAAETFRPPDKITHTEIVAGLARQGDMLSDEPEGIDCFCPEPT